MLRLLLVQRRVSRSLQQSTYEYRNQKQFPVVRTTAAAVHMEI